MMRRIPPTSPPRSGSIALHKGDPAAHARFWKRAIDQGIPDARLCLSLRDSGRSSGPSRGRYSSGVGARASHCEPDFDDAHYQLALLEKNAGHYEAALREFHAMRIVAGTRAYAYWLAAGGHIQ